MEQLPILPLGQLVVYPHVVLPLALTDPNAVQLIDEVVRGNKRLLLGVVKPVGGAEPVEGAVMQARADELYEVGTLGSVVRMLKLGDGSVRVMVQGLERARLVEISPGPHWLVASYTTFSSEHTEDARTEALKRTVHAQFSRVIDIAPYLGEELHEVLAGITDAGKLADVVAASRRASRPRRRRSSTASSSGCARCRPSRPSTTWRGPISRRSPRSRGAAPRRTGATSRPRGRSWTATTTT